MKKITLLLAIICFLPLRANALTPLLFNNGYLINTPATSMISNAVYYLDTGNYSSALEEINRILTFYPDDPQAHFVKSQINLNLNNIDAAIKDASISINGLQHTKLYLWRAYLYTLQGKEENFTKITNDIDKVFETNDLRWWYSEKEVWGVLNDKNIPSTLKYSIYKYIINKTNKEYGNILAVPIIANYIQYIYSLDNNDILFKKLGKNKQQILISFSNAFTNMKGKYSGLIRGILILASGDLETGSNIINQNLEKIYNSENYYGDYKSIKYAVHMVDNSSSVIKPKVITKKTYGLGIQITTEENPTMDADTVIEQITNPKLTTIYGIQPGDYILKIGEENVSRAYIGYISDKLKGEKESLVKITFGRKNTFKEDLKYLFSIGNNSPYKTYTQTIPREIEIPITEYHSYQLPSKYRKYSNIYM